MKFPVKLLYIFCSLSFAAVIALMWYLMLADPLPVRRMPSALPGTPGTLQEKTPCVETLQRFDPRQPVILPEWSNDEEKLIGQTGEKMVLSCLPPASFITRRDHIKLLNSGCAQVSGQASHIVKGSNKIRTWDFQVKVHFFPRGYAEAEFPDFSLLINDKKSSF